MINIIKYQDCYAGVFRELNLEWLEHYKLTESHDLKILDNPRAAILDPGGCIFLAEEDGKILGSAALIPEGPGEYELSKMAVTPDARGRGIGKLLLEACLQQARLFSAGRITLYSNHQLENALAMYRSFGFRDIPVGDSPFATADVRMELLLG
jgi:putative acetyltransferase